MTAVDRELMVRYMMYVIDCEGVSFLDYAGPEDAWSTVKLSQSEIDQLKAAEAEARRRLNALMEPLYKVPA